MSTLNIAAGNMFKALVSFAKTNNEMMINQRKLQADSAEGIRSMQEDCFNAGMKSASNAESAMKNEAKGQIIAGVTGAIGGVISLGSMLPFKFGMGDSATKAELDNANQFAEKLPKTGKPTVTALTPGSAQLTQTPTAPAATAPAATAPAVRSQEMTDRINEWLSGDVRNFDSTKDEEALNDLNEEELAAVRRNVERRQSDLQSRLYEQVSGKKSMLSQAAFNASQGASGFAQGVYNTQKAQDQALSSEFQTQAQIYQEDLNGLSSFAQSAQQTAGSFQEAAFSVSNFNAIQG